MGENISRMFANSMIRNIIYKLSAPLIRAMYKNTIKTKKIKGVDAWLSYPISQHLGFFGQSEINYESNYRTLIENLINPDDIIFDIGANIGQYSVFLSKKLGPNGKILSIEPDTDNYSILNYNLLKNRCNNVTTLKVAISSQKGQLDFYKDTITGGRMSSLHRSHTGTSFKGIVETVEVQRLSDLIDVYGVPQFVKIDVEGAEAEVLHQIDDRLKDTIFFVEVRSETKERVCNVFFGLEKNIFLVNQEVKLIKHFSDIPDFANLLIK